MRRSVERSPKTRAHSALSVGAVAFCLVAASAVSAGSIKGVVRVTGTATGAGQKKLAVTVDQYLCGKEKDTDDLIVSSTRGLRNVVVWLETPPPGVTRLPSAAPVQIDQQHCVFTPRIVVVSSGGTVEFLNSDRLLHNVHSASIRNAPFNRTQPKARTIPVVFQHPEIVRIDCDLHPWMRAWVVVAAHRFYALTNDDGEFTLEGVPPAEYTLRGWHEALGTMKQQVVVVGDGITAITVPMTGK
jgi:plastocyanin